jgi:hypothetical protein
MVVSIDGLFVEEEKTNMFSIGAKKWSNIKKSS